jgi:hypothetical protein
MSFALVCATAAMAKRNWGRVAAKRSRFRRQPHKSGGQQRCFSHSRLLRRTNRDRMWPQSRYPFLLLPPP